MSVSKWRYTEECNGRPCPGDCDHCSFEPGDLISRADAIEAVKHSTAYMHDDLYEAISIRIPSAETTGALDDAIAKYVADGYMLPPSTLTELPSADAVPQLKQTDTLIIADALRYFALDTERHLSDRTRADALRQQFLKYGASMCEGGDDE